MTIYTDASHKNVLVLHGSCSDTSRHRGNIRTDSIDTSSHRTSTENQTWPLRGVHTTNTADSTSCPTGIHDIGREGHGRGRA